MVTALESVAKQGIIYEVLQEKEQDITEAAQVIANAFTTDEPMTRALGISYHEFFTEIKPHIAAIASKDLSIVARCEKQGKIVGVSLAESYKDPICLDLRGIFAPVTAMLKAVAEPFFENEDPPNLENLLINFMVGVDSAYQNEEIGFHMMEATNKRAKQKGFQNAVGSATSTASLHLTIKQFYDVYNIVRYRSFVFDGREVFKSIQDVFGCVFVVKSSL